MEQNVAVNRTDAVTDLPLCFQIDKFNHKLTNRISIECVLLYIFLALLAVITVCGNLLVIISIIYFKQLHTPTNSLILSLAVADLLVGVVVIPFTLVFPLSSCLLNSSLICKVRDCFGLTLCTCSILNLCCISVDRYHAVCQPLTYQTKISHCVVVIMILVTWLVSGLIGIGFIIGLLHLEKCEEMCFLLFFMGNTVGLLLMFYFPAIIMLCIYLKIFVVAQKQARSIQNTTKSGPTVSKTKNKATKTLAIVMGVFLICWTPYILCITCLSFSNVLNPVTEAFAWLAMSNSVLNPLIYAFFYSWFRSAFAMIISGKIFHGDFTNTKLL